MVFNLFNDTLFYMYDNKLKIAKSLKMKNKTHVDKKIVITLIVFPIHLCLLLTMKSQCLNTVTLLGSRNNLPCFSEIILSENCDLHCTMYKQKMCLK